MTQTDDSDRLIEQARRLTEQLLTRAATHFGIDIPRPRIRFDLRGMAAGQARIHPQRCAEIRYNARLLAENGQAFLARTVPHEVAHLIAHRAFGPRIRPHGAEWRQVMALFEADPSRCHRFDVSRSGQRRMRRYPYRCGCRTHQLSAIRHNRIGRGQHYHCLHCGERLIAQPHEQHSTGQ